MTDEPMAEEPVPEDPMVRAALRLLPIPEHDAGFWDRVSASLDAADAADAADGAHGAEAGASPKRRTEPLTAAPVGDDLIADSARTERVVLDLADRRNLGVVPPALRKGSNLILSAIAVAAAVAVVVAGAALVRDRSGNTGDQQAATSDATSQVESAPGDTSDDASGGAAALAAPAATSVTDADRDAATKAVSGWLAALAAGDTEAAWDALGPASRQHWGSEAAFADERSALAEGYGAWAEANPDLVLVTSAGDSPGGPLVVVTMVGTVAQEGVDEQRADAFPVRLGPQGAELEPWADIGPVEIVAPTAEGSGDHRGPMAPDDDIVVVVPAGASAPIVAVDAGGGIVCGRSEDSRLTDLEGTTGQRCAVQTPGGLDSGQHVLTVVVTSADGTRISALAVRFEVS